MEDQRERLQVTISFEVHMSSHRHRGTKEHTRWYAPARRYSARRAAVLFCLCPGFMALAQGEFKSHSERLLELEEMIHQLREQNQSLQKRVEELERDKANRAPVHVVDPVTQNPPDRQLDVASPGKAPLQSKSALERNPPSGRPSPIRDRRAFEDEQVGAPRPGDLTLDPSYRGFFSIPNTPVLARINAKPRVDFIIDTHNAGDPSRFRPGQIPTEGSAGYGGSSEFNVSAQGSRIMLDVRAPEIAGHPRFYYENDFFGGSPNAMSLRVRQLYGQLYNVIIGQTWSTFADPDAFADTVDYEGANASVVTRQPLIRGILPVSELWQVNLGIEQPDAKVDLGTVEGSPKSIAPDFAANLRWEKEGLGHLQLSGLVRVLGVSGGSSGSQEVVGFGTGISGALEVFGRDHVIGQVVWGEGMGRYGHDSGSFPSDAAIDSEGNLRASTYFGLTAGYTHHWNDTLRSALTYGYVNLDSEASQATAYCTTHYGALNLVWRPFSSKNLSLGLEGLYGVNEVKSGAIGDDWRVQVGVVYSLF